MRLLLLRSWAPVPALPLPVTLGSDMQAEQTPGRMDVHKGCAWMPIAQCYAQQRPGKGGDNDRGAQQVLRTQHASRCHFDTTHTYPCMQVCVCSPKAARDWVCFQPSQWDDPALSIIQRNPVPLQCSGMISLPCSPRSALIASKGPGLSLKPQPHTFSPLYPDNKQSPPSRCSTPA
jgi:hypothetical protein